MCISIGEHPANPTSSCKVTQAVATRSGHMKHITHTQLQVQVALRIQFWGLESQEMLLSEL